MANRHTNVGTTTPPPHIFFTPPRATAAYIRHRRYSNTGLRFLQRRAGKCEDKICYAVHSQMGITNEG